MKKLLTIALTGVLAASVFAVESDPSNTVGFINQVLPTGFSTFSFCPVGLANPEAAGDYIAGQGTAGDIIYSRDGAAWVAYAWSAGWAGLNAVYNKAYLYKNNSGSAQSLVVAGDVIPEGTNVTMATFSAANYNGFGNPLPMNIDLDTDDLSLDADGFQAGDRIYEMVGGAWVNYNYNGTTYGVDLMAGEAYLFYTASAFTWDYTIPTPPAVAVAPVQVRKVASVNNAEALR
jgi:hypothetical protein